MFDRKPNELPPFKYNVGDKIMGYHTSIGGQMLVGGEIFERQQSTSYLDENEYKVKLEPEFCETEKVTEKIDIEKKAKKDITWWISEKEAIPFNQDIWNRTVKHWLEHCRLQRKSYLEYVRMHRVLRGESTDISDEDLEQKLEQKYWRKDAT